MTLSKSVNSSGMNVALVDGEILVIWEMMAGARVEEEGRPVKIRWDGQWDARLRRVDLPKPEVPGIRRI